MAKTNFRRRLLFTALSLVLVSILLATTLGAEVVYEHDAPALGKPVEFELGELVEVEIFDAELTVSGVNISNSEFTMFRAADAPDFEITDMTEMTVTRATIERCDIGVWRPCCWDFDIRHKVRSWSEIIADVTWRFTNESYMCFGCGHLHHDVFTREKK